MYTLKATYRIVTPLFAGGADQQKSAELRTSAFKGVLRFWYRAVALPYCNGNWHKVREQEKELFGSTKGQASFMLKLQVKHKVDEVPPNQEWAGAGSTYLGYGLIKPGKTGITTRPYIEKGPWFTATLAMPKRMQEMDIDGLKRALKALGLFGGMGSRSRKGFGSLALESLLEDDREIWTAPKNDEELGSKIQELFSGVGLNDILPEYSAFSGQSRVTIYRTKEIDSLDLLDEVGREMVRYRSYGQKRGNKRVILVNEEPEQIFSDDHDLIWAIAQGDDRKLHPRRVVFGLPHNYRISGKTVSVLPSKNQRRASPLFIHIHQLTGGCCAVFTLLPARFLPQYDNVKMAVSRGNKVFVAPNVDYKVINDFIDRFDGRLEVLPSGR